MMTLEQIAEGLRRHRLEVVAAEVGLSYNTVRRYMTGRVSAMAPATNVLALSEWLERNRDRKTAA